MKLAIISAMLFILAGCATLTALSTNSVVQAGVKWALIDYMSDRPDKASYAEELILDLKEYAGRQDSFTVSDLEDFTIDWIPWSKMSVADQSFALDLIAITSDQLRSMVGDGLISEDEKVNVQQFLNWVLQAIRFVNNKAV